MEYSESGNLIFIRLQQGEDLFDNLRLVCEACKLRVGIVISGIGMLKQAELNYFVKKGDYSELFFPEPMELVSLTGNIILEEGGYNFHLHAVLARSNKEAVAGHLSKGKVNVTNEIVSMKTAFKACRKLEESTGLKALTFK